MKRDINVIGIDIAKRVFHVIGMDTRGTIILRKRLYRGEVMSLMAQLPRATVGMEAYGWTPVRDRSMGWHQCTPSSHATTLESNKSVHGYHYRYLLAILVHPREQQLTQRSRGGE